MSNTPLRSDNPNLNAARLVRRDAPATVLRPGAWPTLQRSADMSKRTCSVDDCENPHYGNGWCSKHYTRWRRYGDPHYVQAVRGRTLLDHLLAYIDPGGDCWEWIGAKNDKGYGQLTHNEQFFRAHRAMWEELVGAIPEGLQLDHLCRNPSCVNPDHLEPVTTQENTRRGIGGHQHRAKTHCPQGHPYSGENLYIVPSTGSRRCLTCDRARHRREEEAKRRERRAKSA